MLRPGTWSCDKVQYEKAGGLLCTRYASYFDELVCTRVYDWVDTPNRTVSVADVGDGQRRGRLEMQKARLEEAYLEFNSCVNQQTPIIPAELRAK